jgi:hypothetical protein
MLNWEFPIFLMTSTYNVLEVEVIEY